jgi:hypothetical protein
MYADLANFGASLMALSFVLTLLMIFLDLMPNEFS